MRRSPHVFFEANDARHRKDLAGRAQNLVAVFNALGHLEHQQRHRALDAAHMERLVARVENQHARSVEVGEGLEG